VLGPTTGFSVIIVDGEKMMNLNELQRYAVLRRTKIEGKLLLGVILLICADCMHSVKLYWYRSMSIYSLYGYSELNICG
jgi:hypothetical protein